MPLFLCDREFVSDQRWRVDMNEFYEELKKNLIETNTRMIEYKKLMERIAFEK